MQATNESSDESAIITSKDGSRASNLVRACIATGIAAILGIWHARTGIGAGLLAVNFFVVPMAQVLLALACMIVLQTPCRLPRDLMVAILFASASVIIEIIRAVITIRVFSGLIVQGILLAIFIFYAIFHNIFN